MGFYSVYVTATGEIVKSGSCPAEMMALQAADGQSIVEGIGDDTTQYVLAGIITDRPVQSTSIDKIICIANGADIIHVIDIPIGAEVSIAEVTMNGLSQIATTSTADLSFDVAGEYQLKIELFPYLPYETMINAT